MPCDGYPGYIKVVPQKVVERDTAELKKRTNTIHRAYEKLSVEERTALGVYKEPKA